MKKQLLRMMLLSAIALMASSARAGDKTVVKYSFDDATSPEVTAGSRVSLDYTKTSVITNTVFLNAWNNANGDPGASTISLGNTDLSAETWTLSFEWAAVGGCNSKQDHTILKAGETVLFDINGTSNWNTVDSLRIGGNATSATLPVPSCDKNKRFTAGTGDQMNTNAYWHHIVITGSSDGVKLTITNSNSGEAIVTDLVLSETNVNPTSLIIEPCCGGAIGIDELSLTYNVEGEVIQTPMASYTNVDGISRTITATCDTEGTTLYYSTDGENWTEGSSVTFSESGNIYFKAVKGSSESDVLTFAAEAGVEIVLNTPAIVRNANGTVTISADQSNLLLSPEATIYYTYGDDSGSFIGTKQLTVAADATITAYAEAEGYAKSADATRAVALFPEYVNTLFSVAAATSGWSSNAFSNETITASERTYATLLLDDAAWSEDVLFQTDGAWGLRASGNWYINSNTANSWLLVKDANAGNIVVIDATFAPVETVNAVYAEKYSFGIKHAYIIAADGNAEFALIKPSASEMDYFYGVNGYSIMGQLDIIKTQLTEAIAQATALNAFANDADLASAIADAQAAVADEAATLQTLAAAATALDSAAKSAAKATLSKAITLAGMLNSPDLATPIAEAAAVNANTDATTAELAAAVQALFEASKPVALNLLATATQFAQTYGYTSGDYDLVTPIQAVSTAVNSGNIGQIQNAIANLMQAAKPAATDALTKLAGYAEVIDNAALTAAITQAQGDLDNTNPMAVINDLQTIAAQFKTAATEFVQKIAAIDTTGKNMAEELATALQQAVAAAQNPEASIVTIGEAIQNLVLVYRQYEAANTPAVAEDDAVKEAPEGWTLAITNGNLAGDDVSNFFTKDITQEQGPSVITAGAGKNGSRGIVVKSAERTWDAENSKYSGDAWDTQFWIKMNEALPAGTMLHVEFDYKANKTANVSTQCHYNPGDYIHWSGIGSWDFTDEWQTFSKDIEVSSDAAGSNGWMSIAFNLAEETSATEYYFDNFGVWYKAPEVINDWTDIIVNGDMEGDNNECFYVTEQAEGGPYLANITEGIGKDGSKAVKVQSEDDPVYNWDSQFFIRLPYQLPAGTKYKVSFDYKANKAGDFETQAHTEPGGYIHWACIGSGSFTDEWQTYSADGSLTGDMSKDGQLMQTIAFNLAMNKVATEFIFDNVKFEVPSNIIASLNLNPAVNPVPYPAPITSMSIVGDLLCLGDSAQNWDPANGWAMVQSEEEANIWKLTKDNFEAAAQKYSYAAIANGTMDRKRIDGEFEFGTEDYPDGKYNLIFTADTKNGTVKIDAVPVGLELYTATFTTNAKWDHIYAYAWSGSEEEGNVREFLGPWPGTELSEKDSKGAYVVSFTSGKAPEKIVFSNGDTGEDEITEEFAFENGKAYEFTVLPTFDFVNNNGGWATNLEITEENPIVRKDITLSGIKGEASNNVKFTGNAIRINKGNSIKLTAPEGATIVKIDLNVTSGGLMENDVCFMPISTGNIEDVYIGDDENKTYSVTTWTGNATEVSFGPMHTKRNLSIAYIDVTVEYDDWTPAIEAAEALVDPDGVAVGKLLAAIETAKAAEGNADDMAALKDAVDQYVADNADREKDETAKVNLSGWKKFESNDAADLAPDWAAPAITTFDGRTTQPAEVYEGTVETTGQIIYQNISGLTNGSYKVGFYGNAAYTSGRGFESSVQEGDEDVAYVFANSDKAFVKAHIASSITDYELLEFNVDVTDGSIKLGMGKEKAGTNWHTMQIYRLTWFASAKSIYAADKAELETILAEIDSYTEGDMLEYLKFFADSVKDQVEAKMVNIEEIEAAIDNLKELIIGYKKSLAPLAEGTYYFINAESGKSIAAGHSWGTQGIVNDLGLDIIVAYDLDNGTYTFDTKVSNGGDKHFLGSNLYMDSPAFGWTILPTGDGYTCYISNGTQYIGVDADDNLVMTDEQVAWVPATAASVMAQHLMDLNEATSNNPIDATFFIQDPNFNRGDQRISFWTNAGNHGGAETNMNVESYENTFNVYQTLTNLPNGIYKLDAQAAVTYHDDRTVKEYDGEGAPVIYANDETSDFIVMTAEDQLSSQGKMSEQFGAGEYNVASITVAVTNNELTIGAKSDRNDIWAVWDNFQLTYLGLAKGDANGDGEVTTGDAVATVNFALGVETPTDQQFEAADYNESGDITVSDAVGIVNESLNVPTGDDSGAAPARMLSSDSYLSWSGQQLMLTNDMSFVGFQMDVTLTDGAQFNGVQLCERAAGLKVFYNKVGENTWRVIALSLQRETIMGNNGALLQFDITGQGSVSIDNVEFTDAAANAYMLAGIVTGINGVTIDTVNNDVYTINGVKTATVRKGIYIINGKKTVVK